MKPLKSQILKTIFLSAFILFLLSPVRSDNDPYKQSIRGTVTDAITGFPLPGAHVILIGSNPLLATTTDINGNFILNDISLGRQNNEVRFVGYASRTINNILLTSGKQAAVLVTLEEESYGLDEVAVTAEIQKENALNEMAYVSARTFSVEETERYAGSLGDPARMVANFAGVMTQNDSRNDIIIRGNSPLGVLWRIEGIEVPNPNHFGSLGSTGGPVSMINNNLMANSDFLTGAFPAEYGNATAGVFDINLRSGNANKTEFVGQIGFNGFEVGAEGPAFSLTNGQKATYLANFRYSTLEVMDKIGVSTGTGAAIPQYKDFTFLFDLPGTKTGRFKVFGLWGTSFINLGRDLDDKEGNQYNMRNTATDYGSDMAVIGLTHTYFFNENTQLKTTFSAQEISSRTVLDSVRNDVFIPYFRSKQSEQKLAFSTQLKKKLNKKANFLAGFRADQYDVRLNDSVKSLEYGKFITLSDAKGNLSLFRTFGQYQHQLSPSVSIDAGLHMIYSTINDEFIAEPRAGLKWQLTKKNQLTAGFGMHSQLQPKEVYFMQTYLPDSDSYVRTNENVKMTKINHFVIGFQNLPSPLLRLKAEAYYQHLYNIPVSATQPEFSMVNAGDFFAIPDIDSLVNQGKGRNIGLEITVERFLNKGWYMLLTASIFDSKATGYDKVWRNTAFNGNYVFNLLGGYEFKTGKNSRLTIDLKTVWAGGKRYIPVDLKASLESGEEVRDWSKSFETKYGDYFRTDLRIGYKINFKGFNQEFAIDLQNLGDYKSVFMESYDPLKNEVYPIYQQGFLPMFLYRIQF